jgi:pilus assembly protein CpaE
MGQPDQQDVFRVLIVDNAPAVRQALCWLLDDTPGFHVVGEAADGETAVARTTHFKPDIVILDIHLPRLNGYEVARILKQMERPPRILFLTGSTAAESRRRAMAAGGDAFVEKGEGWPALIEELERLTTGRKSSFGSESISP